MSLIRVYPRSSAAKWFFLPLSLLVLAAQTPQPKRTTYFPAAGAWQRKTPEEVGMDTVKLLEAVAWAESHGAKWDFEKDQVRTFGKVLGPLPAKRAATNGVIL